MGELTKKPQSGRIPKCKECHDLPAMQANGGLCAPCKAGKCILCHLTPSWTNPRTGYDSNACKSCLDKLPFKGVT